VLEHAGKRGEEKFAFCFFSASLVAAIRVMEISCGTIGSIDWAKAICTGPRT
jgi:hypothetical protein